MQETRVQSLGWKDPQRREWQPTPVFLPGESHGQRSLMGSMGLQRVRYNGVTNTSFFFFLQKPKDFDTSAFFYGGLGIIHYSLLFIPYIKVINEELLLSFSLFIPFTNFSESSL